MLKAVAIANRSSGSGNKLRDLELPFDQVFEPGEINWAECLTAELLVMFGGDGTIQHTVTTMLNRLSDAESTPALAIVPYGTTNMSARTINTSRRRRDAVNNLKHVLNASTAERLITTSAPILKVTASHEVQYGYALGVGAIANFVQEWRDRRGTTNAANQLRSLLSLLRGLRNTNERTAVRLNDRSLEVYAMLLTTLRELIYGTTPFWGSGQGPEAGVRATWIRSGTPGLFSKAPALLRGSPEMKHADGFFCEGFRELTLNCAGPLILDGEVYDYRDQPLTISAADRLRWVSL